MAWQQYPSWTPVGHNDGDLGSNFPQYDDSFYHGHFGPSFSPHQPHLSPNTESYEMNDRQSYISSAPLLQDDDQSMRKSSTREPLIREVTVYEGRYLSGWKAGVLVCAVTATIVCLLNASMTIWAVSNHPLIDGVSYLFIGSCQEVAKMSLWIHLGINAMSTALLSASNYTMQVISSPTRKEVDKAHARNKWLDIGVPSTRNLRAISWGRICMWTILGLSSIPLHLLYNTAVFSSLSANAYDYLVVSRNFINSNAAGLDATRNSVYKGLHNSAVNGRLVNYTAEQCIAAYSTAFVSKTRNVVLVTSDGDASNSSILYHGYWSSYDQIPYAWLCGDGWSTDPYKSYQTKVCTPAVAASGVSKWTLGKHRINYCLVEEVVEKCELSFSFPIMLVVIVANASKAFIMILTVWKLKEPTLVTLGDAISSFLHTPDPTTTGICLSTKTDIQKNHWRNQPAKKWQPKKQLWFRAASVKRWLTCNILCIATIAFGGYLLSSGMDNVGTTNLASLYAMGFGTVSANSLVGVAPTGLLATTLFANLPQAILSFLYLTYNGLFSCMLGGHEWSGFGRNRKSLRVTRPMGTQRTSYYLQLPYTYAIPLLLMSGGLHWLMSQSLFLALVTVYGDDGLLDEYSSISTVGYSCIAIFFALILGSIAVVGGMLNGFRRYGDEIPLVGSCSAAISAACHRSPEDSLAYLNPVQWGVVQGGTEGEVEHCSFSSWETGVPIKGHLYAGLKEE